MKNNYMYEETDTAQAAPNVEYKQPKISYIAKGSIHSTPPVGLVGREHIRGARIYAKSYHHDPFVSVIFEPEGDDSLMSTEWRPTMNKRDYK